MEENKQMILAKITDWQEKVKSLQDKKTKLEIEFLHCDIELNKLMIEYDKLCKKLLNNPLY